MGQALSGFWAFVSLVMSVGQEFGSNLAGWLWLRVSYDVAVKSSSHLRVWGCVCFQTGSLTGMAAWFSPHASLHITA